MSERKPTYEDLELRLAEVEEVLSLQRAITANMAEGVCLILARDGTIVYANPTFEKMFGYGPGEISGKHVSVINAPTEKSPEDIAKDIQRSLKKTGVWRGEVYNVKKEGTPFLCDASISMFEHPVYGRVQVAVHTDITKRKQAENRIVHLNSILKAIRNVNQLLVVEKDKARLLQKACDVLIETRGYSAVWIGISGDEKTFSVVKGSGFKTGVSRFIKHVLSGDYPHCIKKALAQKEKILIVDKFGTCGDCFFKDVCVSKKAAIIRIELDGRLLGLLAVLLAPGISVNDEEGALLQEVAGDIAFAIHDMEMEKRRKQAELALQRSEEKHRSLIESSVDPIYLINRDLEYIYANKELLSRFGKSGPQVFGHNYGEFHSPEGTKLFSKRIHKVFESKKPSTFNYQSATDGRYFLRTLNPVMNPETGAVASITVISKDITDLKQTEAKILMANERLQHLLYSSTTVIYSCETSGDYSITYSSENVFIITGYLSFNFIKDPKFWIDHIHPEDREFVLEKMLTISKTENLEIEYRFRKKEGKYIWLHDTKKLIRDEHGTTVKIVGSLLDVTERKQAVKALEESEKNFRALVENSFDGIMINDISGNYLYSNKSAAEISGYSIDELLKLNVKDLTPSADVEEVTERIRNRIENRTSPSYFGGACLRKDGKEIQIEITAAKTIWKGKPAEIISMRDITERKRMVEELKSAHKYARNLIDSSLNMIIAVDKERRIVEFNKAAQESFGYIKAEVLGKHIDILYANPSEGVKAHNTAKKTGQFSAEIMNKRKNGELFPAFLSASILRDKSGEFLGIMGVSRDITKLKQSEKERENLQAQLLQSQKMESIGSLTGGIAHDFNNLLTIISGYSQLMLDCLDKNNPLRKNVEKIMKAGEQAASLTRQLLAFSRKQVLEPKVLDLNTVVTDVEKMLGRLIGEDIKIDTVLEPDLVHVKVDPGQIEQVIMNLVVNAQDAMPDGGKITVKTENVVIDKNLSKVIPEALPGRFVRFSVEDSGAGIDKAILDKIFEPFFTTKDVGVGTGLGLSVVYGIIKQHAGWINVYSEPGTGTIFKVYLPAVSEKIDDITKDTISFENLQGNGERILLVEDEEGIRGFAAEALRKNGYTIFEAANAKEAFDLFKNESGNFDLVFSDVVMPGKSGLELVDELLSGKPDLQVLLCSGYSDKKSQWSEIKKRGFRFLQKPYGVSDLLKSIKEMIQKEVS